jgi:CO/xanthine dehydrogenase FAD-binding subunit
MKPAPFEYCCPDTVDEAVTLLASMADAKVMAGGQSLVPMMNFRVVRPDLIVDISRLLELDFLRPRDDGGLTVGALTRHRILETSPLVLSRFPIVPETMRHVAHLAIRNRGTIGGSLSHADPAAELPMLAVLLDAVIVTYSVRGERQIPARKFFVSALTTVLTEDELVIRIEFPGLPRGMVGAFDEASRRPGDFAMAAVGVLLAQEHGVVTQARVAMMGVGETPLRSTSAEEMLMGHTPSAERVALVTKIACSELSPKTDLHASSDFRKHLAGVVMSRVIFTAWQRATRALKKVSGNE